ncbi:MAG: hypothetical protein AAF997_14675 [Myxococcota bacterium]
MRLSIALVLCLPFLNAARTEAQTGASAPNTAAELRDDGVDVIDSPPPLPAPSVPSEAPAEGVVLQRPGQVLLSGTPVKLEFRSPTNGVGFQLQAGGAYSSISGISYGAGFGYGYGAWGYGGYGFGAAPYYGEVVTRAYQPICEAPCEAILLSGRHRIALTLKGGAPVNVRQPVDLTVPSIVEGRYKDKSRLRKAGWAVFVSGAVAGMVMMFASVDYRNDPFRTGSQIRNPGVFYSGVGIFLSSIIAGSVLASQNDEAYVNVYPVE